MKPYPAYKDSGIEWIGEIPEHWGIKKLNYLAFLKSGESITAEQFDDNGPYPVFGGNGLRGYFSNYTHNGEYVLIGRQGALCGNVNYSNGKFWASEHAIVVTPLTKLKTHWLGELLRTMNLNQYSISAAQPGLSVATISALKIPVPSFSEQKLIANFLNHKTSQIDTLIEKKQKQIELLKEERTAIINQAVTKGLNPDVPMKDSGIEWLGEVPEHWGVARLKIIAKIKYGLGQPPRELENGLPLIRATNISQGKINPQDLLYVDPNDVPHERDPILKENDIIVVRSGAYTGDSAIIPKTYEGAVSGYDMVVRTQKANPEYIAYSLLSHSVLHNQIDLCKFRAAQPHLNAEELGNTLHILPPFEEQKTIVDYINKSNKKMGLIELKAESEINLLQEYRTALISNAVTGKIDIREKEGIQL